MTPLYDAVIIWRLVNIPIHETIGAMIELALLCVGLSIKLSRWEKK